MSAAPVGRLLLIAAALGIAAAVAAAIVTMGSPAAQREKRLDSRRVEDMKRIESSIDLYLERQGRLPGDLAALARQPGVRLALADPATAVPYRYSRIDDRAYRLCAVFATDTADADAPSQGAVRWSHGKGEHCYNFRSGKSGRD